MKFSVATCNKGFIIHTDEKYNYTNLNLYVL